MLDLALCVVMGVYGWVYHIFSLNEAIALQEVSCYLRNCPD